MKESQELLTIPPEAGIERMVGEERDFLKDGYVIYGSGYLPSVRLSTGENLTDYMKKVAEKKGRVSVLDLGAGHDCAAWTGGIKQNHFRKQGLSIKHPAVQDLEDQGVQLDIFAQSGSTIYAEWVKKHGIKDFFGGHFLDAIKYWKQKGQKFDVITTQMAVYQTAANLQVLESIDELLDKGGAAFTDSISKLGSNRTIIIPSDRKLGTHIRPWDVHVSLSFQEAMVGGVAWRESVRNNGERAPGNEAGAWRKGEFDRSKMPKLSHIAEIKNVLGPPYRVVYTVQQ